MFHGSQKVVESFFRRTRFRRSKKLRSSFRGSFINRPSSAHRSTPANQDQVRSIPANQDQDPTTTRSRTERAQFKIKIKRKKSNKMADRVMNTNEDVVVVGGDDDDVVDFVDDQGEELPLIDRTENEVVTTYNPETNEIIKHHSNIYIDRTKIFEQFGKNKTTDTSVGKKQMPEASKPRPKTAGPHQSYNNNNIKNNINTSNNDINITTNNVNYNSSSIDNINQSNNNIDIIVSLNNNNYYNNNNNKNNNNRSINSNENINNMNNNGEESNNNNNNIDSTNNNIDNTDNNINNNNNNSSNNASNDINNKSNSSGNSTQMVAFSNNQLERTATDQKLMEMLRNEVSSLKKELKKQKELVGRLQEREKQLQDRLSEQARRQLAKGSSKFEDLSLGANRPTQLIKRYGNLYSEARVDALDALENLPELSECDDLKTKLLLSIIVLSFRSTQKTLLDLKTRVREMLHIPRVLQSGLPHLCHAANDLEDDIGVYLRKTLDKHDLRRNYNEVSERVWITLFDYPSLRNCNGLTRYIEECVSVAWSLTVQNPPMLIDYEMGPFDQTKHSRFHTSDPNSKAIKVYLWPALTEGEKGACVSKGIVIT